MRKLIYQSKKRRVSKEQLVLGLVLFLCTSAVVSIQKNLMKEAAFSKITETLNETAVFRAQLYNEPVLEKLDEISGKHHIPMERLVTVSMAANQFDLSGSSPAELNKTAYEKDYKELYTYRKEEMEILEKSYSAIWKDLKYFPVPNSLENNKAAVDYENSWQFERTFGGKRGHEGTDIMASINQRGYYPVISMTDGIVEQIGWLTQGGYRIGVRSPSGGYFYYAHLHSYAKDFQIGDTVLAGELLGFMGDTGYSEIEGTTGNFDVHLHLGIYIKTKNYQEISVNPYWILKYLEKKKLNYVY